MPAEDEPLALSIALDLLATRLAAPERDVLLFADPTYRPAAALRLERLIVAPPDGVVAESARAVLALLPDDGLRDAALRALGPGGRLALLSPGPLAGWFGRLRGRGSGGALIGATALSERGLTVDLCCGIGQPSSLVWAALVRAAERAGRPDLADRFEFRYRRSLAPRRGARLAETVAIVATRPS